MIKKFKIIKIFSVILFLLVTFQLMLQPSFSQTSNEEENILRRRYQELKEQYQQELNWYRAAQEEFINARKRYMLLKNNENMENLRNAARNYLKKIITSLIRRLETMKTWVSNRKPLSEEGKAKIIEEINKDINWLSGELEKIQNGSSEELGKEARIIQRYWKNHRIRVKRIIGQIWVARVEFAIKKAEDLGEEAHNKIENLKAEGKDTTQLEGWFTEFNHRLNSAREKCEEAKIKFAEIRAEPGVDPFMELHEAERIFREGHSLIVEAIQQLKEAHKQLIQIIRELKNMGITNIEEPLQR